MNEDGYQVKKNCFTLNLLREEGKKKNTDWHDNSIYLETNLILPQVPITSREKQADYRLFF